MTMVSLGLSTTYHHCLKPCTGLVDAALVDLHGFWVVCFKSFNNVGKTLALKLSSLATAVSVRPCL